MKIDKAMLAVRHACSKDETRQNLIGIRIEDKVTIGTDGRILATVENLEPNESPWARPAIHILAEDCTAVEKAIPKTRKYEEPVIPVLVAAGPSEDRSVRTLNFSIGENGTRTSIVKDEHTADFPDWQQCVPKGEVKYRVAFNPALLAELVKIIKAAAESDNDPFVTLEFYDEPDKAAVDGVCNPIRVTSTQAPRFSGLLMPVRG
jgi:hypothetical protein